MGKYSIGLDLGINNVGWAIYDLEEKQIVDKGVVRYKEASGAQDRRGIRGSRRLAKRKRHRVERLAQYLYSISFCTQRSYEPDLLQKRIKGLKEKLTEQEITNILYYFSIHRGYIPFDEEKLDREVHQCIDDELPCFYIQSYYEKYKKYRGQCELILMKDNMRELETLLTTQKQYHSKINDEVIQDIMNIVQSKRQFWEGPGGAKDNQLTPYGRYATIEDLEELAKDPTYHKYLYEVLIGKCELSMDKTGHMDSVAPACNYFAEEFNFYNDFINMSVKEPSKMDEAFQDKVKSNNGKFTEATIEEFKTYILCNKTINFDKMIQNVLGLKEEDIQGYRIDKNRKPEFTKFEFYKYVKEQMTKKGLHPNWLEEKDRATYNKIVYVLTVAPSAYAIEDMLTDRISNISFSKAEIEILQEIKRKKNAQLRYHALSESILKKALNDIKKYHCELNFMQIMKRLEYEKEMKEYFQNHYSTKTKEPFPMEEKYIDDIIANPQVKKTLRKAIKVINAIMKQQKDYPDTIIVESTKEMNGKEAKQKIEKEQAIYKKLNEDAEKILIENGYPVQSKNIDKVIFWQETNHKCAYCGKEVSLASLLQTDLEHILPKSKTMDSSSNNLTCSCPECNTTKSNRTPYEYLTSINSYQVFKERVLTEFKNMPQTKKDNLLFEGSIEKYSIKFINRNLRDTAYGTVALIEELAKYNTYLAGKIGYQINVISAPGQLTSRIRKNLDLSIKNRDYLYHHAVDAMILAGLCDTPIGQVLIQSQNDSKYWISVNDKQHYESVYQMIAGVHLLCGKQIKEFNESCDNQPSDNKEGLLKRSYEVLKNPIRQFSDTNYAKFIKRGDTYYQICQIDNIYNYDEKKDKKLLNQLFDPEDHTVELLCYEKDKTLYHKLKQIYDSYPEEGNPFRKECIYKNGLEEGTQKFEYLLHGIHRSDDKKSPIVVKLRYMKKITNPYIKQHINPRKKNQYGEFINSPMKETTIIGLDGIQYAAIKILYAPDERKFVFLPIPAICHQNGKLNTNHSYYIAIYNRLVGKKKVIEFTSIYCGEWIGVIKKNGEYKEGRYSTYNKFNNKLILDTNGLKSAPETGITANDQAIIIYTTDILGNRYVRLDSRKIL